MEPRRSQRVQYSLRASPSLSARAELEKASGLTPGASSIITSSKSPCVECDRNFVVNGVLKPIVGATPPIPLVPAREVPAQEPGLLFPHG